MAPFKGSQQPRVLASASATSKSKDDPEKLVTVTWKGRYTTSEGAFNHFMEKDLFCDVHLFCDSHHFLCHRVILAAGSQYFQEIFEATCIPACNAFPSVVVIANFNNRVLRHIISYIYNGSVKVPVEEWEEFLRCAQFMKLRGLDPSAPQEWTKHPPEFCANEIVEAELHQFSQSSSEASQGSQRKARGRKRKTESMQNSSSETILASSGDFKSQVRTTEESKGVGAKKRNSFVPPAALNAKVGKKDEDKKGKVDSKLSTTPSSSNTKTPKKPKPSPIEKPVAEKKPRKSPAVRQLKEDGPDVIMSDILDTVDVAVGREQEIVMGELMTEYEKIASEKIKNKSQISNGEASTPSTSTPKAAKKSKPDRVSDKESMEKSIAAAIKDVENEMSVSAAATNNNISLSTLRGRLKKLGITSTKRKSSGTLVKESISTTEVKKVNGESTSNTAQPSETVENSEAHDESVISQSQLKNSQNNIEFNKDVNKMEALLVADVPNEPTNDPDEVAHEPEKPANESKTITLELEEGSDVHDEPAQELEKTKDDVDATVLKCIV